MITAITIYYYFIFGNYGKKFLLLLFIFPIFVTFFTDDSLLLVAGEGAYVGNAILGKFSRKVRNVDVKKQQQ